MALVEAVVLILIDKFQSPFLDHCSWKYLSLVESPIVAREVWGLGIGR
jgi:hypothetical protein